MSWSKVYLLLVPLLFTAVSQAARIQFRGTEIRASLDARPIATNAAVSPVSIVLNVPGVEVNRVEDGFDELIVHGLVPLDIPGTPALYTTGSLIAVPNGYEPRLIVEKQETREVNGVLVKPTQKQYRCDCEANRMFQFNSEMYRGEGVFPEAAASLEEVGYLQGLRLVRVNLTPAQEDFKNRRLVITTELRARVEFAKVSNAAPVVLPRALYDIARSVTVNGRSLGTEIGVSRAPEKMLVFVADTLTNDIAPLVKWQRAKGLEVEVYTLTQAGGTKEKLKEFIQAKYDQAAVKPTYLLFAGNKTTMPAFTESTSSGAAISDYRYAVLTAADKIPDVLYGRIIANDAADVARQVNRLIAYERNAEKDGAWYSQGFTIASNEGSGPSDKEYAEQVRAALKAGTYTALDAFNQGDGNATPANIKASLATGRTWISYFGHGSGTSWGSTNGSFSNSTITEVQNPDRLPVIIDVACLNSSWMNLDKPFGKAWVTHTVGGKEAGALAFYGGSVSISWHPPAVMSVGVSKYHFEKPVHSLGGTVAAGQLYLVEKMGTGSDVIENIQWYNLFGDPSLLIRTATPKSYQVKAAEDKSPNGVTVTVKATDATGAGVKGLTAALGKDAGVLAVGETDATGKAVLTVPGIGGLEPGTVLTTTGYNAETQQVVVH